MTVYICLNVFKNFILKTIVNIYVAYILHIIDNFRLLTNIKSLIFLLLEVSITQYYQ